METQRLHWGRQNKQTLTASHFLWFQSSRHRMRDKVHIRNKPSVSLTPTASPPGSDEATSETGPPSSDRPLRRSRFGRIMKPPRRLIL
ncbi:hypothetical protein MTO96_028877 [Rhipicephalus appendiculatus]